MKQENIVYDHNLPAPTHTDEFYRKQKREKIIHVIKTIVVYAVLIFFSVIVLFPFVYMVLGSFRTYDSYLEKTTQVIPNPFTFDNYRIVFEEVPLLTGYKNTFIVILCELPLNLFFVSMEAFAFSKLRLRNKTFWLLFLLSGMMVPGAVLLMPRYIVYSKIGWINTLLPLIVPGLFSNSGRMFFFIQYMMGIPSELFEAAKVDGCGYMKMHLHIMLPLLLPALAAQAIFGFMGSWNEYFAPSIYLLDDSTRTLQAMLANFNEEFRSTGKLPVIFAGATLSCIPMVVLYLILQKYFIKSMAIGAVKG